MFKLHVDSIEELAEEMTNKYDSLIYDDDMQIVDCICDYETAQELIRELVLFEFGIGNIEVFSPEYSGYNDLYIVGLFEGEVTCERAARSDGKGYLYIENQACYVINTCNSDVLKTIDTNECYEVSLGEEFEAQFECLGDCGNCDTVVYTREGNDIHGINHTISNDYGTSTVSFYSSNSMSNEEVNSVLEIMKLFR